MIYTVKHIYPYIIHDASIILDRAAFIYPLGATVYLPLWPCSTTTSAAATICSLCGPRTLVDVMTIITAIILRYGCLSL